MKSAGLTNLLDPRPGHEALRQPWPGAVNIPFDELAHRTHELPPRGTTIAVVGPPDLVARTVAWLQRGGRMATAGPDTAPPASLADAPLRMWRPNPAVAELADRLVPGYALDVGCGTGRDAVALARAGWRVTGVDLLPDALERARDLERRYVPGAAPIDWRCVDVRRTPDVLAGAYDLILILRFLPRPLLRRLPDWLRPNGHVLIETFTIEHQRRHGRPAAATDVLEPGELPRLLPRLEVVEYAEGWRDGAHVAHLLGRAGARE